MYKHIAEGSTTGLQGAETLALNCWTFIIMETCHAMLGGLPYVAMS